MNKTLSFLVCFLLGLSVNSQTVKWVKSESFASHFSDYTKSVTDVQGSVYVISYWNNNGLYFVKYDKDGNKQWEKPWTGYAGIRSFAIDNSGQIYVVIVIHDSLKVEGKTYQRGDLFLKYKPNGSVTWIKKPSEGYALWFGKKFDGNNKIMCTGAYDPAYNKFNLPNTSELIKPYLGQIDTSGTMLSAKAREGSIIYPPCSQDGFFFAQSYMYFPFTLGQGNDTVRLEQNKNFIAKYDASGNRVYAKYFNGNGTADSWGNFYGFEFNQSGDQIVKLGQTGNQIWRSSLVKSADWYKLSMVCNVEGGVFFAGGFKDFLEIGDRRIDEIGYHLFVSKWDSSGKFISLTTSSGSGFTSIRDMNVEGKVVYITGDIAGSQKIGGFQIDQSNGVFTAMLVDDNNSVSIKENNLAESMFNIYPNPSANIFYISSTNIQDSKIRVLNSLGQNLKEVKAANTLDLSGFSAGTYFVQMINQKGVETKKIIVE